jgi:hypothetical protein
VSSPLNLYWREDSLAKLMRRNKINDRRDLSARINQPYSTVCENLALDWSGRVKTFPVLVAMCQTFKAKLSTLVYEPKDRV